MRQAVERRRLCAAHRRASPTRPHVPGRSLKVTRCSRRGADESTEAIGLMARPPVSAGESWVDGRVGQRAETERQPDTDGVAMTGRELPLSQQHFFFGRFALLERELIADPCVGP